MSAKRKKRPVDDPLEAYRKVRKPVAPPGKVIPDRRRKLTERAERRDEEQEGKP